MPSSLVSSSGLSIPDEPWNPCRTPTGHLYRLGQDAAVDISPRLLTTGAPGIGKTTVADGVLARLRAEGVPVVGFVTRELREGGQRVGFVVEVDGPQAMLAHVARTKGPQVGRYRVDVAAFERVALPALEQARTGRAVVVVDELAQMELASTKFVAALGDLFELRVPLLATVHQRSHPVTDRIKQRTDVEVIEVTEANREALSAHLSARLSAAWRASQRERS